MRLSSFRALLLALAMVVQAIAGGIGVARATPAELALAAHCGATSNEAGDAGGGRQGRHHHCDSCCLCAGPSSVPLAAVGSISIGPRTYRHVSFAPDETSAPPARLVRSQRARGPPLGADRA